jgi:hypothetical protein
MLALVRPGSWNLPLFLHLVGATVLVGALIAVTLLLVESLRRPDLRPDPRALLVRIAFRTQLAVAIPAWILMRVAGQWLDSKEGAGNPTWLSIGVGVADGGVAALVVLAVLLFFAARRSNAGLTRAAAVIAPLYLAALAVAVWAMSAKPD